MTVRKYLGAPIGDLVGALEAGQCPDPAPAEVLGVRLRAAVASGSHTLLSPEECQIILTALGALVKGLP